MWNKENKFAQILLKDRQAQQYRSQSPPCFRKWTLNPPTFNHVRSDADPWAEITVITMSRVQKAFNSEYVVLWQQRHITILKKKKITFLSNVPEKMQEATVPWGLFPCKIHLAWSGKQSSLIQTGGITVLKCKIQSLSIHFYYQFIWNYTKSQQRIKLLKLLQWPWKKMYNLYKNLSTGPAWPNEAVFNVTGEKKWMRICVKLWRA